MKGGFGNDRLQGYGGKDIIHGNEGNDKLIGGSGNDSLYGNQNRDVLYGNQGNDLLDGGWGNDTLYGNQNQDILYGNQGNDLLDGGWGNDTLYGNQGKDTLYGGAGADVLSGNQDRDIFVYKKASDSSITESDTITDFTAGTDKLLLNFPAFSPIAIGSVNSLDEANVYFDGSSIQVAFSATESVLYVDSTAQGRADMAINLNSVSSLDISDFA